MLSRTDVRAAEPHDIRKPTPLCMGAAPDSIHRYASNQPIHRYGQSPAPHRAGWVLGADASMGFTSRGIFHGGRLVNAWGSPRVAQRMRFERGIAWGRLQGRHCMGSVCVFHGVAHRRGFHGVDWRPLHPWGRGGSSIGRSCWVPSIGRLEGEVIVRGHPSLPVSFMRSENAGLLPEVAVAGGRG